MLIDCYTSMPLVTRVCDSLISGATSSRSSVKTCLPSISVTCATIVRRTTRTWQVEVGRSLCVALDRRPKHEP